MHAPTPTDLQGPIAGDAAVGGHAGVSITDFLTDGSLAAMCAELTDLTGIGVRLRDPGGRLIAHTDAAPGWVIHDSGEPEPPGSTAVPLVADGRILGTLVMAPGDARPGADARRSLEGALRSLAAAAGELCDRELELRHRIKEIGAVFRLTNLLSRAAGLDRVLEVVLDSALDVLGLDAGSIMLLKEDADGVASDNEEDLVLRSSRNLSREWLECPMPLSRGREFDRQALKGEVVVSPDLLGDERVLIRDRARAEGLGAAIHAGLVFQSRPLGVMRLYARGPRTFTDADVRLLKSLSQQAALAVEQARLLKFEAKEQRVQQQLQLAADIQRRMFRRAIPSLPGLDLAAKYLPSFELGGDFYDFIDLGGHVGMAIGDVVGKGIAAALLMSAVRASLRAHVQGVYDLDEVVARVNQALCRDTQDNEFASLWYGVIDPVRLRLTYCSAGHEPIIVAHVPRDRPPTAADVEELSIGGMVVGVDPAQRYQRGIFDLRHGDVILGYTDGVIDAVNFSGEKHGKKRLRGAILRVLSAEPDAPAARIAERLVWEVRQFTGLRPQVDDETIVVVRVNRRPG